MVKDKIKNILLPWGSVILMLSAIIIIFQFIPSMPFYLNGKPTETTIREIMLSDNTILFIINLGNITCYVTESKTNGYVDVEIDCK